MLIIVYLIRHYVFTFSILRCHKHPSKPAPTNIMYEPTVSILVPAHNEDQVIGPLLHRLSSLTYPQRKLDVIVIDDASSDETGVIADEYSKRFRFITALHRNKNSGGKGKSGAMNEGLKHATGEIVLCFDADYFPPPNIVEKLVKDFADPQVGAVQGRPVVVNEPQNLITRLVAMERMGGYGVDQPARDGLGLIPQFGGTVGGFRRSVLNCIDGFDENMLTEDTDLTFQIYLAGYKIRYVRDAECYEEAVASWGAYWRQRYRWAKGHMQVCFKHSFNVLKSTKLNWKEKLDGMLLLNVYFMPVLALLSLISSAFLVMNHSVYPIEILWFFVPLAFYSCVGNFAPFFEVGIGAHLDGRTRTQWLMPLLLFAFLYNIPICAKALADVVVSKLLRRQSDWGKTTHTGNSYMDNLNLRGKNNGL
ncbi:MAG: glycosyltransferase family 2 protein [Candidatus Bathyarchaeota archaeon]|nr:glycosyltransferase family 2 protein [Candidatus Bathyarchaeota archaeon]